MTNDMHEWWRGAAIYQIYPRSFLDTNGDGVGDLPGIVAKLDYIADLGVDAIWISPFYKSPMDDFGYDVQDYCDIDPMFGNFDDFDRLLSEAHARGLRIIIDQIYSHTSDRHAWFEESRQSRDNAKADWYVWADAKRDGSPPNNWQSVFTPPAWTWDGRRRQYYMHNFLASQPDLNLHNPAVRQAILDVARFWLDRGVDGFRLDAINHALHDVELRDNPVAPIEAWDDSRPLRMQRPVHNSNHAELPAFMEALRNVLDEYEDKFTVAEVGGFDAAAAMKRLTSGDGRLNTAYNFEFLGAPEFCAERFASILGKWSNDAAEGWPSWAFSNHDVPRAASRWGQELDHSSRCALMALFLISLRGNVFVYQGEELGLTQAEIPFERIRDPEALRSWPQTLGRDGARTPMPWDGGAPNAGFTSGEPWLPLGEGHDRLSVKQQTEAADSVLHTYQRLLKLRRVTPALIHGDLIDLDATDGVLAFARQTPKQTLRCAFNFTSEERACDNAGDKLKLLAGVSANGELREVPSALPPYSGYIAEVTQ